MNAKKKLNNILNVNLTLKNIADILHIYVRNMHSVN